MQRSIWLVLTFFAALLACEKDKDDNKEADPAGLRDEIAPTEVVTYKAAAKTFNHIINTNGKVQSSKEVALQFRVAGIVSNISAMNGQRVEKGDVMARVENSKYILEAKKAEINMKERALIYQSDSLGFNSANGKKLDKIRENLKYSSGLALAEVAYQEAKINLENTVLRAPISGIISDCTIREGNHVESGAPFCTIHDPSSLTILCDVLESDAFTISPGQVAEVKPIFETRLPILATVVSINPRVNEKSGLVSVLLKLNDASNLVPGVNVQIGIKVPYEKRIVIPKEAIIVRSGRKVVFTLENEQAKWNYVTTGRENQNEIEIVEGLKENQEVIITNNLQLSHDARVTQRKN